MGVQLDGGTAGSIGAQLDPSGNSRISKGGDTTPSSPIQRVSPKIPLGKCRHGVLGGGGGHSGVTAHPGPDV